MRDSFRNRVLVAEASVTWQREDGKTLVALRNRIMRSQWWGKNRKQVSPAGYMIRPSGQFRLPCADYDDTSSLLYGNAWPSLRLMHAMAHHTVEYDDETSAHGPEFAKAYLGIVRRFLGQEAKDALAVAFATHKVKTRTWSAAAKQDARQRTALRELKKMREELNR